VAEVLAVVLLGDPDLRPGNDGAGQRGAEQVAVLVDGIALNGAEHDLLDELALQVLNDHALSTEGKGLLLNLGPVLLLADVGEEAHDCVALYAASTAVLYRSQWHWSLTSRMSHFRIVEVSRPVAH
jgi:hypothetical protein